MDASNESKEGKFLRIAREYEIWKTNFIVVLFGNKGFESELRRNLNIEEYDE